jgi:glucosamine 6-phosphate synthetase-like amidotransferase/phosphosugar isomerase protein
MPPLRSGPPYLMWDAIVRQPDLAGRLATNPAVAGAAAAMASLLQAGAPFGWPPAVVGCGTSEHAAMAAAAIWREAWSRAGLPGIGPVARQALEAALDPWPGTVVGISHEGASRATIDAMIAARDAGARVGLITAGANSPAAAVAEACLCTTEVDLSWCHTIAYSGAIIAAALVADRLAGRQTAPEALRAPLDAGLAAADGAARLAHEMAASRTLVVVGSGNDRIAGREMTLKIEEAAYVPTAYRDLETMLHGHIPALDVGTGLILVMSDREHPEARGARARRVLAAVARVGVRPGAILTSASAARIPAELTPAGRVVVPDPVDLPGPVASLLATVIPLQLTTYQLALALGTNPDALRREFTPYRAAADEAEADGPAGHEGGPATGDA